LDKKVVCTIEKLLEFNRALLPHLELSFVELADIYFSPVTTPLHHSLPLYHTLILRPAAKVKLLNKHKQKHHMNIKMNGY
jgi:hypothetical protein